MKTLIIYNMLSRYMGLFFVVIIFILSGCATEKYVGEQLSPVEDRVSKAEDRAAQAEGQVSKLTERVTANEGRVTKIENDLGKTEAKAEQALANSAKLEIKRSLVKNMTDGTNFAFNSSILSDEAKQSIDAFWDDLKGDADAAQNTLYLLAGHTDNRGSEDYNYELGKRRADAVNRYLVTQKKIDPLRVVTISYGETAPIAGNDTSEGRAKNRRVEISVYNETVTTQ